MNREILKSDDRIDTVKERKNPLDLIFKLEKSTPSHFAVRIFGIKFNCLKSEIKKERQEYAKYYQSFKSASDIPKAEGGLRFIQKAETGFLKAFDSICAENGINYWIDFGTLLGSVRHNGFIPWDDDIDVGMTREDYKKIICLFQDNSDKYPDLEIEYENNKRNKCFVKIKHKKSENLFIDIFPYDFYHSKLTDEQKKDLSLKIAEFVKSSLFRRFKTVNDICCYFKKITNECILDNKSVDLDSKPALFMGIDFPHKWKNKVYDYEDIFPLSKIKFEGIEVNAPNKPERVLQSIYGDFMKIPKDSYPRHSSYLDIAEEEKKVLEDLSV